MEELSPGPRSLSPRGGRLLAAALVLSLFPFVALVAPLVAREPGAEPSRPTLVPFDPDAVDLDARLRPPGRRHLLGTDDLGRDVLARLLHGARLSVGVGLLAAATAVGAGLIVGVAGGARGGAWDRALLFAIEVVQAFPALVLVAAGAAVLPPSGWNAALLIALTSWPDVARIVRAEARRSVRTPYVEAARAAGAGEGRVVAVHVLPATLGPALALAPYVLGAAVLTEAGLSFLGLGAPPPQASWGRSLADARETLSFAWWCAAPPALALLAFVLSARRLGAALAERAEGGQER